MPSIPLTPSNHSSSSTSSTLQSYVNPSSLFRAGELLTVAGVIAGVYGSNKLPSLVPPIRQKAFMAAVNYMTFNGLAVMAISSLSRFSTHHYAGMAILAGGTLFSGSIGAYVLSRDRFKSSLFIVAPIGILICISGYISLAF